MRRVVVTGMGVVSPLGCELDVVWDRLLKAESGIGTITRFDTTDYASKIAGEVSDYDPDPYVNRKERRRMDMFSEYALVAAAKAVADAALDMDAEVPERAGCIVGSGIGGLQTLEVQHKILLERGPTRCSPFMIPQMITNMAAGLIAIHHNLKGPNYAPVSACATAAHCIGDATRFIQRNEADVMVTGGAEAAICPLGIAGFNALRALSTRNDDPKTSSRPFDRDRDGFVMSEGGAILVLEELEHAKARGANIYCEVSGYGATCDAYHMTAPTESGEGAARAMKTAVADAGMDVADVDYINAHGTSTQLNDKIETLAIKTAFGEELARKIAISSSKSMTGHMLGAAGGVESIVCALAIKNNIAPPTANFHTADPECDLDYVPNEAREMPVNVALNNSLGFGGHNCCLLLKRAD